MNPNRNSRAATLDFEPARVVEGKALTIAGPKCRFDPTTRTDIPQLWMRYAEQAGGMSGPAGIASYGLCWSANEDEFDYLAGREVVETAGLPADFKVVTIPAQRYAVFRHEGPAARLSETVEAIFEKWLPHSGEKLVSPWGGAPDFFERYGGNFDPVKGTGDIEVWMPVEKMR